MKKIETTVRSFKLDEVKAALVKEGIQSMTFTEVGEFNRHNKYVRAYRGVEEVVDTLPKMRIEVIVNDDQAKVITNVILAALRAGQYGDCQITILPVDDVIRIPTRQRLLKAV